MPLPRTKFGLNPAVTPSHQATGVQGAKAPTSEARGGGCNEASPMTTSYEQKFSRGVRQGDINPATRIKSYGDLTPREQAQLQKGVSVLWKSNAGAKWLNAVAEAYYAGRPISREDPARVIAAAREEFFQNDSKPDSEVRCINSDRSEALSFLGKYLKDNSSTKDILTPMINALGEKAQGVHYRGTRLTAEEYGKVMNCLEHNKKNSDNPRYFTTPRFTAFTDNKNVAQRFLDQKYHTRSTAEKNVMFNLLPDDANSVEAREVSEAMYGEREAVCPGYTAFAPHISENKSAFTQVTLVAKKLNGDERDRLIKAGRLLML